MRRALWAVVSVFALVSISCADGTDEKSSDLPLGGTTAGQGGAGGQAGTAGSSGTSGSTCGNGVVDYNANEQCEQGQPHPECADLNMGTGMVLCSNCRLMMMCTPDNGMGGNGAQAGNGG